jgi:6-pyruvoyltetrahydropterin/6-carboxytetrahydropterin synthase
MLFLTRRYYFSASHRLYNPAFTEAQNWEVFGLCNNPNGHGHNYELEVTVSGQRDAKTGMLVDIVKLDDIIKTRLIDKVDHKHFNLDVDFMDAIIPTAENIVVSFWEQLEMHIPAPARLFKLRLVESRNNAAEYHGEKPQTQTHQGQKVLVS